MEKKNYTKTERVEYYRKRIADSERSIKGLEYGIGLISREIDYMKERIKKIEEEKEK